MKAVDIKEVTIEPGATIRQAMQAIGKGEIGCAFVVEESGSFRRVLTDGDVRRALLDGHGLESSIDTIPFKESVTVKENTPLESITPLFSDKIRLIPVLDKNNHIVDYHLYDKRKHIAVAKPLLDDDELQLVSECIITGWVSSGGAFIEKFEEQMSEFCQSEYAVACSSATTGLHLALLAHGIGPGDEVIVPSLTFVATANAVSYTGATPVFVDCDPKTWTINNENIQPAITSKSKAIIPVHLYGHPADMDSINELAHEYNLVVIEDAAEAHGATYKNRAVGSLGDIAVFSFFGNKIITTGEGGMITTNDSKIAEKCRLYRDHGMSKDKRYWHDVIGYNYRMTNIQAALGVAQMKKINKITARKKEIAHQYNLNLEKLAGVTLPNEMPWASNVYWLYTILVDEDITNISAEQLSDVLHKHKIESRPVFPPMHLQPIYKSNQTLPVSEKIAYSGISLPSDPEIRDKDIKEICSVISDCISDKIRKN